MHFGGDPFTSGSGAFISQIFGLSNGFKLQKAEKFILEFSSYIKSVNPNFKVENVNNQDFQLFFEDVIVKVSRSRSEEKIKRLRNAVFNQMINPLEFDIADKYLDLVNKLDDCQIQILAHFSIEEPKYLKVDSDISRLNRAQYAEVNQGEALKTGEFHRFSSDRSNKIEIKK